MWHFSFSVPAPRCLFISLAQLWPLLLPVCFCPTAHENRRGERNERSHQLHLNKEEAQANTHGMIVFFFLKWSTHGLDRNLYHHFIFLCETRPWMICTKPSGFHSSRRVKTAERACWQPLFSKMLTAWAPSHCYLQQEATVLARDGARSWSCVRPDKCFCPVTVTAGRRCSLLASNLHWHL